MAGVTRGARWECRGIASAGVVYRSPLGVRVRQVVREEMDVLPDFFAEI
ncbi:hypothetical protein [Sphingosinithalassobacter sp. LHW66-3]